METALTTIQMKLKISASGEMENAFKTCMVQARHNQFFFTTITLLLHVSVL